MTRDEGAIEQALRIVRRRKVIVLQALIGVPLIALALSLTQEKEYTATATLLFRDTPVSIGQNVGVVDPTREAATNGELVALPVVADEAAASVNDAIPADEILGSIEVTPSTDADTAAVSATTTSAQRSAEIANAYGSRLHRVPPPGRPRPGPGRDRPRRRKPRRDGSDRTRRAAGRSAAQTARPAQARPGAADRRCRARPESDRAQRAVFARTPNATSCSASCSAPCSASASRRCSSGSTAGFARAKRWRTSTSCRWSAASPAAAA